ncbi:SMI1/KNR4 family protein [Lysinibacillus sp. Bpr_S20]|uniref:SMI1/KNR4 family protein n=1 Tax=Lysinibacillus sp. Bpr_S20 TaxID=2933964 RepID=UPI0032C40CE5
MLSTHDIIDIWGILRDLLERNEFDDFESVEAIGPVKTESWWNVKWIPFAESTSGDLLCIDLDPANGGEVGQIITFWHDWKQRKVIAPNLESFIYETLTTLNSEKYQGKIYETDEVFEIGEFLV